MNQADAAIMVGVIAGFVARVIMLRTDYRHYPTYPHGYVTHLSLGFIAAFLGAVAVPAVVKPDYAAATFLALAAEQFRNVRVMERDTLHEHDEDKLVRRGMDYIEGIAKVFEARNYLVMLTALISSGLTFIFSWPWGILGGVVALYISQRLMGGEFIGEIADVMPAEIKFDGPLLMINGIMMMNVGLVAAREKILREGLAVIIKAHDDNARLTLDDPGQRQAILHDLATILGTKKEVGEPDFSPLAKKNIDTGEMAVFLLANERDSGLIADVVRKVPVLESSRGTTLYTRLGRKAAD